MFKFSGWIKKGFSIIVVFVYVFVILFQNLPFISFIDTVKAESEAEKVNLALILVDGAIYNDIKSDISWYAKDYIQAKNKNYKAIVLPIDTNKITAEKIYKLIENLYFNGQKDKTSFLKGIILVGNIPLPVVYKDGYIFSSIYPYVDIVKPTFIYDKSTGYFKYSGQLSDIELFHGIIKFNNIQDYHKYFKKLNHYAQNPSSFVDKKLFYDNFVSAAESFNSDMLKYYLNKLIFAENIITRKITPLLMEYFSNNYKKFTSDTFNQLTRQSNDKASDIKSFDYKNLDNNLAKQLGMNESQLKKTENIQKVYQQKINSYFDRIKKGVNKYLSGDSNKLSDFWSIPTKTLEKALKGFTKSYSELFGNQYASNIDNNVKATSRYGWTGTNSTLNILELKDTLSLNYINKLNKFLEKKLDEKIEQEKYFLTYPVMEYYISGDNYNNGIQFCKKQIYETFFFGKNAKDVNSLKDIHVFRGTWGNYTGLNILESLPSRNKKSSISYMNGLFNLQTRSIRGFNTLKAKSDGDNFKRGCSKQKGACIDLGRYSNSEQVDSWAKRIYGGYSPINLDINQNSIPSPIKFKFKFEDYKQAWHPSYAPAKDGTLFDLAGTNFNWDKQSTDYTDSIQGIKKYAAVWRTKYYNMGFFGHGLCNEKYQHGANKVGGNYYDYFSDFNNLFKEAECSLLGIRKKKAPEIKQISNNKFIFKKYKEVFQTCDFIIDKEIYYKIIDTRIKHTSPTKEQFSGFTISTYLRPVDSENYISFLGVGGGTVKLKYPDLFAVEVYKEVNGDLVLKKPTEILETTKEYLKSLVRDYNNKLQMQLNNKDSYYSSYKKAFDNIPFNSSKPHNYNLLSEDYFINLIGEKKLAQISEMLYYLNLGWSKKPKFNNLKEELDYLYSSFDISEKLDYITKNYLDSENSYNIGNNDISKDDLNFPSKVTNGYEVGVIVSENNDTSISSKNKDLFRYKDFNISNLAGQNSGIRPKDKKKECGRPLGEAVILWEWPSAFMCRLQETLKKPFKISSTSSCSVGPTPSEFLDQLGLNDTDREKYLNPNKVLEEKYKQEGKIQEYEKFKSQIDNNVIVKPEQTIYSADEISGSIIINNYFDSELDFVIDKVHIWSAPLTGNCVYFKINNDYLNSCEGFEVPADKWKLNFYFYNPKTGEGRYYSYKAGERKINIKFCNSDNICYVKQVIFSKSPGDLKYVEIKPFSDVMIYGGENPIIINGYDASPNEARYVNKVTYTPYNYKLYLEPEIGVIKTSLNTKGVKKLDYNFSSSQKLIVVKSNSEAILGLTGFDLVLKLDPIWAEVLSGKNNIFREKKVRIGIVSKEKLTDYEVTYNRNYQIPETPDNLFKQLRNNIKVIDKSKLWKINIKPIVLDKVLKTPVEIESTDHFVPGTFQTFTTTISGEKIAYEDFVKQNKFLITGDNGIDVYLLPTFKIGDYKIKIHIPGIKQDYIISNKTIIEGNKDKFSIKKLYIKLDKYKVNPGEKITGKIYAIDDFGNIYENLSGVNIQSSDKIRINLSGNSLTIRALKSGYIKASFGNVNATVPIHVNKTFLPLNGKISVMYLNLFGYDWGKYAPSIMTKSNKNLAITTFLHKNTDIKQYQYIIGENLKHIGDFSSIIELNSTGILLNLGNLKLNYSGNFLYSVQSIEDPRLITQDGIYYVKEPTDDYIKENYFADNGIFINGKEIINFSNLMENINTKIVYSSSLTKKYNFAAYEVFYNGRKVGTLYFKGKVIDANKLKLNKPLFTKIINIGSTNGLKAFGISVSSNSYKSLIKYDFKNIGFRGKFKNVSLFASGLPVGLATKDFANEFIINYGDPFLKRVSKNKLISQKYTNSNLNISQSYGYKIYSSIKGGIKKVVPLDFNNDRKKDLVILYSDSKLRLLKNYKGDFENLGNLMILDGNVKDISVGDVNGDGYEDIFAIFSNGSIRVYKNNHGEFDVNGIPVCLNLAGSDPEKLKYNQIFFYDMNKDGKIDIVANDLASNVKIFFGPSYLSKNSISCDTDFKNRLKEQLVRSYSLEIDPNQKFADAGYIYWEGLKDTSTFYQDDLKQAFKNGNLNSIPKLVNVDTNNYYEKVKSKTTNKFAFQDIPKRIGPNWLNNITGDYVSFKKVEFLSGSDPIKVYKTMEDLNGRKLMPGDKVKITIHVENPQNKKLTYFEVLKGPFDVISINDKPILTGFNGITTGNIFYPLDYPYFLFKVDNVNNSFSVDYYAIFRGDSSVKIKVGDWDKNGYGEIKVFPKDGCIKGYDYFQGQSSSIPMSIADSYVDLKEKLKNRLSNTQQDQQIQKLIDDVRNSSGDLSKLEKNINLEDNIWETTDGNLNASLEINGPNLSKLKSRINGILNGLCNGFSFGKSSCGGIQVPCNRAFLAPGIANFCGCPGPYKKGFSVFNYPGTKWINCSDGPFPIPVPNHGSVAGNAYEDIAPTGCGPKVFPSVIRLYVMPTLTAGIGFAACFGLYKEGMTTPVPPFGAIAGNCIVVAGDISTSCSNKNKNGDEVLDDWMNDLYNGVCSSIGDSNSKLYPSSAIKSSSYNNFSNSNLSSFGAGLSIAGRDFISFQANAHKINSLKDAEQLLEGGTPIHLNIKMGTLKGIFSCIIKKWLNKQIQFIISQLTSMTIYITYPQFNGSLMEGFEEERFKQLFNDLDNAFAKLSNIDLGFGEDEEDNNLETDTGKKIYEKLGKYLPSGKGLRELNETLENPFSRVEKFFEEVPLVNVRLKTVVINVPWIGKDELERQISYLENWLQRNKQKIKERKNHPEKSISVDVNKFVNSVQKNIEILNKYRNFPLQLYKYLHLIDTYLSQISCILNKYFDMLIGWIIRQSKIFEKWVDAIVALINIFRTWQLLIDISVNWKSSCGKCRMDTGDLYDCVLLGLCPSLPVLPIPPFKIPDIFIDFSHINLGIDIILPKIKIYPIPIGVFTLPDLPDVGVKFTLPKLPLLPEPPTLPDLPALPAMPVLELPNLPPPPKIPELLPSLQAALNIFKIVGYFRCIIKNGIGLVAEWNVSTRVEQLTARHNRLFPFDFINIDFPVLPFKGFDVRVDGYVNFKLEFSQLYDIVKNLADSINKSTKSTIGDMLELNAKWNQQMQQINNGSIQYHYQGKIPSKDRFDAFQAFVINKKPVDTKVAKYFLNKELEYLLSQKNENYLITVDRKYFSKAKEILKDNLQPVVVKSNEKSVKDIKKKVFSLIQEQSSRLDRIEKILKDMENGNTFNNFDSDIFVKRNNSNLASFYKEKDIVYSFSTRLFTSSKDVLNIIKKSKSPKQYYLEMYSKVLNKVNNKLEGLKYKKGKKFIYEDIQLPVKQSLEIIKQVNPKLVYANANSSINKPILPDPSQAIRGLYMKGDDNNYYNVLADKNIAKKIRQKGNYFEYDFNGDGKNDLVWYDSNNVYIKYTDDEPKIDGLVYNKAYIYNNIISNFETVVDDNGYIEIQGEKFKIWSKKYPVNTLKLNGQSFDDITLKWGKPDNINAYYILYSSRIDILNEIEKKYRYSPDFIYEGTGYKIYGIVVYDKKLGDINEELADNIFINGHKVKEIVYIPINLGKNVSLVLDKMKLFLPNKWKYFRIYSANLNLELKKLNILSSYSNQEVGGEQIIGDNKAPFVEPVLIRVNALELEPIVGTGINLVGYVNTAYKLKAVWKDNIALKYKAILDKNKEIITTGDSIYVGPETYPIKKVYYLYGLDYADNEILQKVTIDIKVPDINLEEVNGELGYATAKISKDMDKTAIRFGVETKNGIKFLDTINGKSIFTGSEYQNNFTGSIFKLTNTLNIYGVNGNIVGEINIYNSLIKLTDSNYKVVGIVENNTLHYVIYTSEEVPIFDIQIPAKEIIDGPNILNTSDYELKQIDYNGYKWCVLNKPDNKCMIYITQDGNFFIDSMYDNQLVVKYIPTGEYLKLEFYKDSVPGDGANGEKIMSIIVREKALINK